MFSYLLILFFLSIYILQEFSSRAWPWQKHFCLFVFWHSLITLNTSPVYSFSNINQFCLYTTLVLSWCPLFQSPYAFYKVNLIHSHNVSKPYQCQPHQFRLSKFTRFTVTTKANLSFMLSLLSLPILAYHMQLIHLIFSLYKNRKGGLN